ncbi:porin [Flavobacterium sp. RSSA_27]|uniref:porin n=1 Tax=Flavobacterium sp. RSSA_27 TaxID=3447667 RepID=UPI003F37095C
MKKSVSIFLLLFIAIGYSQEMQKQSNQEGLLQPDTIPSIIPLSKQSLLKNVDVIFNTRIAFENKFSDGDHQFSNFNVNQFRLEFKGKIHDKVFFRFRDRYTKDTNPGNLDGVSRATDIALVRFDLSSQTKLSVGKLVSDYGGYEFDFNPIDILKYNTIIGNADIFLVGAGLTHALKDTKNVFGLQFLNSRTATFQEQYGATAPPEIVPSKFPLAMVFNWRGKFFNGKWSTTYSYSYHNEAENTGMNYLALGNKFSFKKFVLFYDFKFTNEELDRKGVVSRMIKPISNYAAQDVSYVENWVRAEYLLNSKCSLLVTLMNSKASWNGNPDPKGGKLLLHSFGFIPTFQYLPFKDLNLKCYVAYIGNVNRYSDYALNNLNVANGNTGQLNFGIIAPLLVL